MDNNQQTKAQATKQALVMEKMGANAKQMISQVPLVEVEKQFTKTKRVFTVQVVPTPIGLTSIASWQALPRETYLDLLKKMHDSEQIEKLGPEVVGKFAELIEMLEKSAATEEANKAA